MVRSLAVLALALSFTPSSVRAIDTDFQEWLYQCQPGTSRCISVSLLFEYNAAMNSGGSTGGSTHLTLRMTNHQGASNFTGYAPTDPFSINGLGWTDVSWTPPVFPGGTPDLAFDGTFTANSTGNAGHTNAAVFPTLTPASGQPFWEALLNQSAPGRARFSISGVIGDIQSVWGCGAPAVSGSFHLAFGWFSTCGEGSITFEWDFWGKLEFNDHTRAHFSMLTSTEPDTRSFSCTADVTCHVVPEPSSLLLLATGLFGVGYARRVRRLPKDQGLH